MTVYWHRRPRRRPARRIWAPKRYERPLGTRAIGVTDAFAPGTALPGGIVAVQTPRAAEVAYWLPAQKAFVVGDILLGAGAKPHATGAPLRLCPERWLGVGTHEDLRRMLRPLLDLPVEHVLVFRTAIRSSAAAAPPSRRCSAEARESTDPRSQCWSGVQVRTRGLPDSRECA